MSTKKRNRDPAIERLRIRKKRSDPAYRLKENEANRERMRGRRAKGYTDVERAHGWWK